MDSSHSQGSGPSFAIPVFLPLVDPGDLQVCLLMYLCPLLPARLVSTVSNSFGLQPDSKDDL